MKPSTFHQPSRREGGAILITAVIFLIVLTMFVLAMIRGGTMEERIARNARDQQIALQAAEAMLRYAETTLFNTAPFDPYDKAFFTPACTNGLCKLPAADWRSYNWSTAGITGTFVPGTNPFAGQLNTSPNYVVEIVTAPTRPNSAAKCEPGIALVTARGVSNGGAVAYVQSTVRFFIASNICD